MSATLTETLKKIEEDIIRVLSSSNVPLSIEEIFAKRSKLLNNYSDYGWMVAIDDLVEAGKVEETWIEDKFLYTIKETSV